MPYFDYEQAAREAGLTPPQLEMLCRVMRDEFASDDMMYELHVLRACMAIRDGHVSAEDALRGETPARTTDK